MMVVSATTAVVVTESSIVQPRGGCVPCHLHERLAARSRQSRQQILSRLIPNSERHHACHGVAHAAAAVVVVAVIVVLSAAAVVAVILLLRGAASTESFQ